MKHEGYLKHEGWTADFGSLMNQENNENETMKQDKRSKAIITGLLRKTHLLCLGYDQIRGKTELNKKLRSDMQVLHTCCLVAPATQERLILSRSGDMGAAAQLS